VGHRGRIVDGEQSWVVVFCSVTAVGRSPYLFSSMGRELRDVHSSVLSSDRIHASSAGFSGLLDCGFEHVTNSQAQPTESVENHSRG
jgi:hypothetical protein